MYTESGWLQYPISLIDENLLLRDRQDSESFLLELSHITHDLKDRYDIKPVCLTEDWFEKAHQSVAFGIKHERSIVLLAIEGLEISHKRL